MWLDFLFFITKFYLPDHVKAGDDTRNTGASLFRNGYSTCVKWAQMFHNLDKPVIHFNFNPWIALRRTAFSEQNTKSKMRKIRNKETDSKIKKRAKLWKPEYNCREASYLGNVHKLSNSLSLQHFELLFGKIVPVWLLSKTFGQVVCKIEHEND